MKLMTNRREFLVGGGAALLTGCASTPQNQPTRLVPEETVAKEADLFKGTQGAHFHVGEPCLQAPAETTMGVSWSISGLAKGVVEIADNPELKGSRIVRSGGFGLVPIDIAALQVRIEGLRPATRYWYRTVTTPFTDYTKIYDAKLGAPIIGNVHSFVTAGEVAESHFCAFADTHGVWDSYGRIATKLKALRPPIAVWNGDATNTTQDKKTAVDIFLAPPIADADYAADIPVAFESGNHDFRGSWISKKEEVVMARHPAERSSEEWDLKWNFAIRQGELALIGMDTGEDKPDAHPKWFGLANFEPYRKAQAVWLERSLSRPDIASAKFKVLFCHIPLFASPEHPDYPHDGVKIDPHDFAHWSRECHDLWSPILERHGVKLVIAGHVHCHRVDPPSPGRSWHQVTCGSPYVVPSDDKKQEKYPAIIEGQVVGGRLEVKVHDVAHDRITTRLQIE